MKVKKDGRPFGTTRVLVEPDFDLHPDYALNEALRKITKHGRLDVLAVYLKADPAFALAYWGEAMSFNHPLWAQQDLPAARKVLERLAPTAAARAAAISSMLPVTCTKIGNSTTCY